MKVTFPLPPKTLGTLTHEEAETSNDQFSHFFHLHPTKTNRGLVETNGFLGAWNNIGTYSDGVYVVGNDGETLIPATQDEIESWLKLDHSKNLGNKVPVRV